ncbi:hypothetical protein [Avibacterium paragallinarum]|uniref:Uncharacterized protein n=1 Tax=Avibacterium paragallinarum TaxID=728 RepID=A0A377IBK5_AVIPA|nr:hypothetical protein [Avibacterium paragallinarum]POY47628.1 hypothetical protein C3364_00970 [Avibacterium paragallinarum]RZN75737.1 hypothetical protein EC523_07155 [Avibacterium paragallinarum]RZN76549.1 hypothetical protein EC523_04565 [Avibacterium paragallinarum]STO71893.1 Uncharacterised protein [Avibacterium paragallinarum]STO72613.1 Uncharacterised protein [Avibacterium paragallinarum]
MNALVMYRGKEYSVPNWVNYIATDPTGEVYGFKDRPTPKLPSDDLGYVGCLTFGWDLSKCQFIRLSACKDWLHSLCEVR